MGVFQQTEQESATGQKRRRRILELDEKNYLCSIIGSGLSINDLNNLGKSLYCEQKLKSQKNHIEVLQEALQLARDQANQEIGRRDEEIAELRMKLGPSSPRPSCDTCERKDCTGLDLCGRCVLYIGGQLSLVPHYRQVIEGCGGRFIHHDGGKEDQKAKLDKMLCRADAVICPVNCVSHDACLRAKRLCKHRAKQFIALRSPGVSALARGLKLVVVG